MLSYCLVFYTSGGISSRPAAFLFKIFLSTESISSRVNCPSLMSNCILIILVIGSCVTFGGFPRRFSKSCFHSFIRSCWFEAFTLALAAHFAYRLQRYSRLPIFHWVSNLIYLILYVFCRFFFRYMLANLFCSFFYSFKVFVLVGFFLLHLEAVFTSVRFSLIANVSHGTLDLVLCFFGMYFAAASM